MRRGRRRKIEVPTDTQPQFGDTAADIERRRREREERDERERGESRRRGTEIGWRKRGRRAQKEERRECKLTQILM